MTLAAAALSVQLALASTSDGEGRDEVVWQVLIEARKEGLRANRLVAALVVHEPASLFEALCTGRTAFDLEGRQVAYETTQLEQQALIEALGAPGGGALRRFLDERLKEGVGERERTGALRLLGAHGTDDDLHRLVTWCTPADPEGPDREGRVPLAWRQGFGTSLGQIFDREPSAMSAVPGIYRSAPVALLPTFITTLGERPSATSLAALSRVLGRVPDADAFVLAELGHVARRARQPASDAVRASVRLYLRGSQGALLIEGIVAVGRLEDHDAVDDLIALLSHSSRNVQEQALASLEVITGERHGLDPQLWRDWHQDTQAWWRRHGLRLQREIEHGAPASSSRALLELSQKRFFRHQLAGPVARGLTRSEEELVTLTCATLGHLGSRLAVQDLLPLLEDERVAVRRGAYHALRRITDEDHGEHLTDWQDAGWGGEADSGLPRGR